MTSIKELWDNGGANTYTTRVGVEQRKYRFMQKPRAESEHFVSLPVAAKWVIFTCIHRSTFTCPHNSGTLKHADV